MMKKMIRPIFILIIVFSILFSTLIASFATEQKSEVNAAGNEVQPMASQNPNKSYSNYIEKYSDAESPLTTICLNTDNIIKPDSPNVTLLSNFKDAAKAVQITESGEVQYNVQIEKDGFYNIALDYFPMESKNIEINLAVYIDNETPYDEASKLTLKRSWKNENKIESDSRGNNIRPRQVPAPMWMKTYLKDSDGLFDENLRFYFTKGTHVLKLSSSRADFIIRSVELTNQVPLPSYSDISSKYGSISNSDNIPNVIVEGEDASLKSDSMLYPVYDRSDPATSPSDPNKLLLNTIGGDNWKKVGQWLTWDFNVPEDGYYKISMRARQNLVNGRNSYRRVYIDGEVPFAEMNSVKFQFENDWYIKTLGDDKPYFFNLKKGAHKITLEIIPSELSSVYTRLQDCVYRMNDTYRKIIMITGSTPDVYRDYMIYKDIPDLLDTFAGIRDELVKQQQSMEKISGKKGASAGVMESLILQLGSFISSPDTIPLRLDKYKANISSLSAWLLSLQEQPLELDYIEVSPAGNKLFVKKSNIFERLLFSIRSIIGSFSTNYNMVGDFYDEKDSITVWVGLGRDQAQIVKDLVDNDFVAKTGTKVNINLVQQGLIEATLAGKGPDIALFVASSQPVNLAARGALVDLKKFRDYDTVSQRFMKEALVPFQFEKGSYALPATQSFPMLFYRKDIFSELGIKPPETWDEVYRIAPIIQRNNLNIGIGSDIGTFATLMFQKGGRFYNDERSSTELGSEEALNAFTQWTDFFTKYGLPLTYDFQNRFRTGEMPMGIAPYTVYNFLQVSAPEIKNLWGMTAVPGTVRNDGKVDHSVCGGSIIDGCIMFKKVRNKDAAWEFLKWFTSADVQSKLGIALENQMGPAARYPTANVEALKYLPWSQEELALLYGQWNNVKEIPEIPASYYISRNINNAFRLVTYKLENPRHTLNQYNYEMNKEIKRKRIEFGLDAGQ